MLLKLVANSPFLHFGPMSLVLVRCFSKAVPSLLQNMGRLHCRPADTTNPFYKSSNQGIHNCELYKIDFHFYRTGSFLSLFLMHRWFFYYSSKRILWKTILIFHTIWSSGLHFLQRQRCLVFPRNRGMENILLEAGEVGSLLIATWISSCRETKIERKTEFLYQTGLSFNLEEKSRKHIPASFSQIEVFRKSLKILSILKSSFFQIGVPLNQTGYDERA